MAARLPRFSELFGPALLVAIAIPVGVLAGLDPRLAVVAALGCAFVLIAFVDLAAGVAIFGLLSFLELTSSGSVLSAAKLAGLLLAISWLGLIALRSTGRGDFVIAHRKTSALLLAFLAWVLLSASWAEDPSAAAVEASRYALNALLFMIVFTAIATRRDAKLLVAAFVAGACAAAIYGYFTPPIEDFEGRLSTGVLDPNQLAGVLVPGGILAFALAASLERSPAAGVLAFAAGVFCIVSVMMTVSRGGLIALAIAGLAAIAFSGRWRLPVAGAVVALALGTVFYFTSLASDDARERLTQTTRGEAQVREGRTTIWQVGWRAFEDKPVRGVGAGNFQISTRHYLLNDPGALGRTDQIIDKPEVAHNTYLQVLAELGVIGVILFLGVILVSLGATIRAARTFRSSGDGGMAALSIGLIVALLWTLAADFFISEHLSKQLWLLLGLGPALLTIASDDGGERS